MTSEHGPPAVLLFGAKQCKMCRFFKPQLASLMRKDFHNHRLLTVDLARATEAAFVEQGIRCTPTVAIITPGVREPRLISAATLDAVKLELAVGGPRQYSEAEREDWGV